MQFPSGALADRLDDVRVVAAGAVTAIAGAVLFAFPITFPLVVAGMLLIGLGTGVHKTVSIGLLTRVYPDRPGRALGVFDTLGTVGGVLAPAAVVTASATADWSVVFVTAGGIGCLLTVALVTRVPRRPRSAGDGGLAAALGDLAVGSYAEPFRDRRFQLFVVVTVCFSFAYSGAVAFLPLYLVEAGLAEATASTLYSGFFAASVIQLLTGGLSDRVGRLWLSAGLLSIAAAALGLLVAAVVSPGMMPDRARPLGFGVAVVALGVGSHGFRPVRGAYLSAVIPDDIAGGGLGLVRTLLMGAGAVAPAVVGVVADLASFRAAFGLLGVVMVASAGCSVVSATLERR
jgi:MFS family permease